MTNEDLVREYRETNDVSARNDLILKNKNLVYKIAESYRTQAQVSEFEDLIQEGFLALFEAIKYWDESKGGSFSNVAWRRIHHRLQRYLNTKGLLIPKTSSYQRYELAARRIQRELVASGESPTPSRIESILRERLKINLDIYHMAQMACSKGAVYSLDRPAFSPDSSSQGVFDDATANDGGYNMIVVSGSSPMDAALEKEKAEILKEGVEKALDKLRKNGKKGKSAETVAALYLEGLPLARLNTKIEALPYTAAAKKLNTNVGCLRNSKFRAFKILRRSRALKALWKEL